MAKTKGKGCKKVQKKNTRRKRAMTERVALDRVKTLM